jgi:hypothetical protein
MGADRATCRGGLSDDLGEVNASQIKAGEGGRVLPMLRLPAESVLSR